MYRKNANSWLKHWDFILLERCLCYCGDNHKLTYILQRNVRGKREIYV